MLRCSKGLSSPACCVCDISVNTSSQKVSYQICRIAYHQSSVDLCCSMSATIVQICPDRQALSSASRPYVPWCDCGRHVAHRVIHLCNVEQDVSIFCLWYWPHICEFSSLDALCSCYWSTNDVFTWRSYQITIFSTLKFIYCHSLQYRYFKYELSITPCKSGAKDRTEPCRPIFSV